MNCRRVERLLSAQRDRELSAFEERMVTAHLAGCPQCRRRRQEYEAIETDLRVCVEAAPSGSASRRAVERWRTEQDRHAGAARDGARTALLALAPIAMLTCVVILARFGGQPSSGIGRVLVAVNRLSGQRPRRVEPVGAPPPIAQSPSRGSSAASRAIAWVRIHGAHPTGIRATAPIPVVQDDMSFTNAGAGSALGLWAHVQPAENRRLQHLWDQTIKTGDDFVTIPFPRLAGRDPDALAAAKREYQQEKTVVDPRLQHKLTLALKATSFNDLCQQLSQQTGIDVRANRSVADDKITLFCTDRPVREILREITQVFGFLWRRSGEAGEYQYELYQDLRSQLMEEELRNRDRNEALIALDERLQGYRKYLNLTPEQARSLAQTATGEDKTLLDQLGGTGWAPAHLYFGLSPDQMSALQAGQPVEFASAPEGNQQPLPPGMSSGILSGMSNFKVYRGPDGTRRVAGKDESHDGQPVSTQGDASTSASLRLDYNDLGQVELEGGSGFGIEDRNGNNVSSSRSVVTDTMAVGVSPSVRSPQNAKANADEAHDPALAKIVSLDPARTYDLHSDSVKHPGGPRVTTADVLEQIHRATGMDIVSDYFTRLFDPALANVKSAPLFDILNRVCDGMRMRWTRADGWLRFRSTSFFNDRLKEVPNRLLDRWAASRKQHGTLTIDDLMEIAQLPDSQLSSSAMADGASAIYGLGEWQQAASQNIRPHWRFLAQLAPGLRAEACGPKGLAFSSLGVTQQQKFVALTLGESADRLHVQMADLASGTVHAEYGSPDRPHAGVSSTAPSDQRVAKIIYRYQGPNIGRWTKTIDQNGTGVSHENGPNDDP